MDVEINPLLCIDEKKKIIWRKRQIKKSLADQGKSE